MEPRSVLGLANDPLAQLVRAHLAGAADGDGRAALDIGHLAIVADCAPSAVQKALRRLAAAGLIESLSPHEVAMLGGVGSSR